MQNKNSFEKVVDFLFENGSLALVPRSGFFFLGERAVQSVAEHSHRTAVIGFSLALLDGKADPYKTMAMCLFHDFSEARISDLNHVHQRYVIRNEAKAAKDAFCDLPFEGVMSDLIHEYEQRESIESRLAKDADQIEMILHLKELSDRGNTQGLGWMENVLKRLKTEPGKAIGTLAAQSPSERWWRSIM